MEKFFFPEFCSLKLDGSVGRGFRIHRPHLYRGIIPLAHEYPRYDSKQSDGVAPIMLELWGMQSTPSLPLLPGSL